MKKKVLQFHIFEFVQNATVPGMNMSVSVYNFCCFTYACTRSLHQHVFKPANKRHCMFYYSYAISLSLHLSARLPRSQIHLVVNALHSHNPNPKANYSGNEEESNWAKFTIVRFIIFQRPPLKSNALEAPVLTGCYAGQDNSQ